VLNAFEQPHQVRSKGFSRESRLSYEHLSNKSLLGYDKCTERYNCKGRWVGKKLENLSLAILIHTLGMMSGCRHLGCMRSGPLVLELGH
jgi:hypothetical protein